MASELLYLSCAFRSKELLDQSNLGKLGGGGRAGFGKGSGEQGRREGREVGTGRWPPPLWGGAAGEGVVTWAVSSLGWGHQLCYY